jgi:beta-lactamase class A
MNRNIKRRIEPIGLLVILCGVLLISCKHKESLKDQIQLIIAKSNSTVGIALKNLDTSDTLSINNNFKYPMQSVYKFALSLAVLNQVDNGKLSLNHLIHPDKIDLLPNTWSPLRDKYPEGNVDITLNEVIRYTVSQSDNNGCDILFRLLGGTKVVEDYIHGIGVLDIEIKGTEDEMHKDWNVQFNNWCKPTSMVQLLELFYNKKILSDSSKNYLWKLMVETTTGPNRIKGLLPPSTIVAHKTGSSGKNENGLTAAVNDVGIIILPNGQRIAVAIFVSNSNADDNINEKVIADISKTIFDYYINN